MTALQSIRLPIVLELERKLSCGCSTAVSVPDPVAVAAVHCAAACRVCHGTKVNIQLLAVLSVQFAICCVLFSAAFPCCAWIVLALVCIVPCCPKPHTTTSCAGRLPGARECRAV